MAARQSKTFPTEIQFLDERTILRMLILASPAPPGKQKGGFRRPSPQNILFSYSNRQRCNAPSMRA